MEERCTGSPAWMPRSLLGLERPDLEEKTAASLACLSRTLLALVRSAIAKGSQFRWPG